MSEFSITFLGTCAYDFSPKLLSDFKNKFDFDARRASCVLFNERFLIDCGPHCCNSLDIIKKDYRDIRDIFITHLHPDHFCVESIMKIAQNRTKALRLWVREDAVLPDMPDVKIVRMRIGTEYRIGDETTVIALGANHDPASFPQWFLFERNEKKFLYALDGAWYLCNTYDFLKKSHLSLLVADGTVGDYEGDYRMAEHNSLPMIRLMLPSLKKTEIIDDSTQIYLSHIAPSLHKPHEKTVKIAKKIGVKIAYDGLKTEI